MDEFWAFEEALQDFQPQPPTAELREDEVSTYGELPSFEYTELEGFFHRLANEEIRVNAYDDLEKSSSHDNTMEKIEQIEQDHSPAATNSKPAEQEQAGHDVGEQERKEEPAHSSEPFQGEREEYNCAYNNGYTEQGYKYIPVGKEKVQILHSKYEECQQDAASSVSSTNNNANSEGGQHESEFARGSPVMQQDNEHVKDDRDDGSTQPVNSEATTSSGQSQTKDAVAGAEGPDAANESAVSTTNADQQILEPRCLRLRQTTFVTTQNLGINEPELENDERSSALGLTYISCQESKYQNSEGIIALDDAHSEFTYLLETLERTKSIVSTNADAFAESALDSVQDQVTAAEEILTGLRELRKRSALIAVSNSKNLWALKKFRKDTLEPQRNTIVVTKDGIDKYKCHCCEKAYKRNTDLRVHLLTKHHKL